MLLLPKIILKIVFEKKNDFLFVDEAFYLVYVSSIIYTVDDCNMQMRFLDIGMQLQVNKHKTSDAGSQYHCRRMGRGANPHPYPMLHWNPFPTQTHTQKASKTLVFLLFNSCWWTDGPTDRQMDGQSLL